MGDYLPLTISYNLPAVSNQKGLDTKDTTLVPGASAGELGKTKHPDVINPGEIKR